MSGQSDRTVACSAIHITLNTVDLGQLDGYMAGHAERTRAWMDRPAGL